MTEISPDPASSPEPRLRKKGVSPSPPLTGPHGVHYLARRKYTNETLDRTVRDYIDLYNNAPDDLLPKLPPLPLADLDNSVDLIQEYRRAIEYFKYIPGHIEPPEPEEEAPLPEPGEERLRKKGARPSPPPTAPSGLHYLDRSHTNETLRKTVYDYMELYSKAPDSLKAQIPSPIGDPLLPTPPGEIDIPIEKINQYRHILENLKYIWQGLPGAHPEHEPD